MRQIVESPIEQGADEEIVYSLTTTPWGSSPTSPSVAVFDESAGDVDVTADVVTGSASVAGDVITLPTIGGLTRGTRYRLEIQFTAAGNTWEAYARINAT